MKEFATPWKNVSAEELRKIRAIFFDIDDTFSTDGKILPSTFQALWKLKEHGYFLIPVTGRPSGWCDHIVRFWPVDAVVGENGAFVFYMKKGAGRQRFDTDPATKTHKNKLQELRIKLQKMFPKIKFASDQNYREYDLAIDICEDVRPWKKNDIKKLMDFCRKEGANCKLSSIHVNTWYGDFDKRKGIEAWIKSGLAGIAKKQQFTRDQCLFIGDSPNDEPMFALFKNSVAVANIKQYLAQLTHRPRWITSKNSGAGFEEMAKKLYGNRSILQKS